MNAASRRLEIMHKKYELHADQNVQAQEQNLNQAAPRLRMIGADSANQLFTCLSSHRALFWIGFGRRSLTYVKNRDFRKKTTTKDTKHTK